MFRSLLLLFIVLSSACLEARQHRRGLGASSGRQVELNEAGLTTTDLCYSTHELRMQSLKGKWENLDVLETPDNKKYYNLSCPFEWGKYSCIHQGYIAHAEKSRKRHFIPNDCKLAYPSLHNSNVFLSNRTLHFNGDSLLKQIMVALGCLLNAGNHINHALTNVMWSECPNKWPCHGTRNCIECGQHSGFDHSNITLNSGATLRYGYSGKTMEYSMSNSVKNGDILILETGIHEWSDSKKLLLLNKKLIENPNIYVIWVITPQDAFYPYGYYNERWLLKHQNYSKMCKKYTEPFRSRYEWKILNNNTEYMNHLRGVLEIEDLENQGDCKVEKGAGNHGDCAHYCQPGPPDILASALFTQLTQILKEEQL